MAGPPFRYRSPDEDHARVLQLTGQPEPPRPRMPLHDRLLDWLHSPGHSR